MKPENLTAWALNELSAEEKARMEAELGADPAVQENAKGTKEFCSFLSRELRDDSMALTPEQRAQLFKTGSPKVLTASPAFAPKPLAWWQRPAIPMAAAAGVVVGGLLTTLYMLPMVEKRAQELATAASKKGSQEVRVALGPPKPVQVVTGGGPSKGIPINLGLPASSLASAGTDKKIQELLASAANARRTDPQTTGDALPSVSSAAGNPLLPPATDSMDGRRVDLAMDLNDLGGTLQGPPSIAAQIASLNAAEAPDYLLGSRFSFLKNTRYSHGLDFDYSELDVSGPSYARGYLSFGDDASITGVDEVGLPINLPKLVLGGTIAAVPSSPAPLIVNGGISGGGGLVATDTLGAFTLPGANAYTGTTTLSGSLTYSGSSTGAGNTANQPAAVRPGLDAFAGTLGTTAIPPANTSGVISGGAGTLSLNGSSTYMGGVVLNQPAGTAPLVGTGAVTKVGAGTLTLAGNASTTGNFAVTGGATSTSSTLANQATGNVQVGQSFAAANDDQRVRMLSQVNAAWENKPAITVLADSVAATPLPAAPQVNLLSTNTGSASIRIPAPASSHIWGDGVTGMAVAGTSGDTRLRNCITTANTIAATSGNTTVTSGGVIISNPVPALQAGQAGSSNLGYVSTPAAGDSFNDDARDPKAKSYFERLFRKGKGGDRADDTETYTKIIENPLISVAREPLSTFSIDVDTASYANVRRFLNQNTQPPRDAVRLEELINYFPTSESAPAADAKEPFAVKAEMAACPWLPQHRLMRIHLKGRDVPAGDKASNLVFLVDVSGSMNNEAKLPLVQRSLRMLAERLEESDHVSMVTYAGGTQVVLPSTNGLQKAQIMAAIDALQAGGSTHGSAGIRLAYEQAVKGFIKGGVNRVILCTDGDFNVGISDPKELEGFIAEKARSGVFLSVLGFGTGNLKDKTMETLADKGNGNYAYIDSVSEARKVLVEQMQGTLVTIAKDVKIQVEFNPAIVREYRLIGYENRLLAKEDFNDDTKDAGEIGAGHAVTALYELVPANLPPGAEPSPVVDKLKYQTQPDVQLASPPPAGKALTSNNFGNEALTIKLRYKEPEGTTSKLIQVPLNDDARGIEKAGAEFKFTAAVAGFGLLLRNSGQGGSLTWDVVRQLAREGKGSDPYGYRGEFLQLVEKAAAGR